MRIVDANVLLYAVNEDAVHHAESVGWLDDALSGDDSVGFAWVVLLAFVRLATRSGLFPRPMAPESAFGLVRDWLDAPGGLVVRPGPQHAERLRDLIAEVGVGGNLVNDAHLAALALEHRAEVVSFDNDFERFAGVRRRRPADLSTR